MDGVLEGAAVLYVCKLACSVLFLPAVAACRSPVSFCCCCLLLFTDLVVTIFLVALWIAEYWIPPLSVSSDVIALRFLLFLSHTYGAVLGMTTPLVAMEVLTRLDSGIRVEEEEEEVEAESPVGQKSEASTSLCAVAVEMESEVGNGDTETPRRWRVDQDRERCLAHLPGFLCCLLVWALSGLHGSLMRNWRMEELWTNACIQITGSLHPCLPNLLTSAPPGLREPCWGLLTLGLLLVLTAGWGLLLRARQTTPTDQHTATRQENTDAYMQLLIQCQTFPAPSKAMNPGLSTAAPVEQSLVDPEKTQSGCSLHHPRPRNQLSPYHHGNSSLFLPLECLWADRGQNTGVPPTAVLEEHTHSDTCSPSWSRCWWGRRAFPCPRGCVTTGLVLSLCALPLNLSVNVLLVCSIEALLEWSVRPMLSVPHRKDTYMTGVSQST